MNLHKIAHLSLAALKAKKSEVMAVLYASKVEELAPMLYRFMESEKGYAADDTDRSESIQRYDDVVKS